jgi:hypothetical protein
VLVASAAENNMDDTAYFAVDSLDDVNHVQFGEGHFYDARTGKNNDEGSRSFDFTVQIIHKNSLDASKPYLRYEDNEGIVNFTIPWGESGDSLYFTVHFYPGELRKGTIKKNGPEGVTLVEFEKNEKTGDGFVIIYDESGKEVSRENS